jgi:hypothetical protein
MVKKDQTDYAAAYRQFCIYGRGRSLVSSYFRPYFK